MHNPKTYIGSGKIQELVAAVEASGAETLVLDDELTPGQLRSLDEAFQDRIRLCDRTALILDIFSQRAATREGQLQVPPPPLRREQAACSFALPKQAHTHTLKHTHTHRALPQRAPSISLGRF